MHCTLQCPITKIDSNNSQIFMLVWMGGQNNVHYKGGVLYTEDDLYTYACCSVVFYIEVVCHRECLLRRNLKTDTTETKSNSTINKT